MNAGKNSANEFSKSPKSSVCIVFLLIVTSLSLNFFTRPAACPMKYADGQMDETVCDCCCRNHGMQAHREGAQHGKATGVSCHCGMCRITNRGIVSARAKGGSMTYLQLGTVACLPPLKAGPFKQYKTTVALFPYVGEKDHPPEFA